MSLLKANVPYEVIMQWDWKIRLAALIVANDLDDEEFYNLL